MRKLLSVLAGLLIAAAAFGAPAYVTNNVWNGAIPVTFQASPATGNQIYVLAFTSSTGTGTFTLTGDTSTLLNNSVVGASPCTGGCLNYTDGHGDTYSLWSNLSAVTPPTVATSTQSTSTGVFTTGTQAYQTDQILTITGTPPTGFSTGTNYHVISAGLSSTTVELSATQGGAVIVPSVAHAATLNTTAQNYNVTQPSGDNILRTVQLEFSGGVATKSPLYTVTASPGIGGLAVGQSVTVATGDILVVICFNSDAFGAAPAVNTAGSTSITSFNDVTAVYWTGTGAAIQPNFNAAIGDETTPHIVNQWIVSATGSGSSCTHNGYTSSGSLATPNGTTGNYVGKSGAFVTPNCTSINYWQPTIGNFGAN